MGNVTYVFERVERKFLLTPRQYDGLMRVLIEYMEMDRYGESTILSLYLDTADSLLIRRSLEKPVYKEKLRLRSSVCRKSPPTAAFSAKCLRNVCAQGRKLPARPAKPGDTNPLWRACGPSKPPEKYLSAV